MSVKIMARVWASSKRKDGELLVMLALADFANDAGECWPSIPTLAQKARLSDRQTRRVLSKLESVGELRRSRSNGGRNRRNHYFITVSENPDKITLKELQGKNNPVICDTKTLTPTSGALNHHRTVNKSVEPNGSNSFRHSTKRKLTRPDPATLAAFDRFYSSYPKHLGREPALRAWVNLKPDENLTAEILIAVDNQKRWRNEQATQPKAFIPEWPHPATWLNQKRWTDELAGTNGAGNEHRPIEIKNLGDGFFEVDGRRMDRETTERRYGKTAN